MKFRRCLFVIFAILFGYVMFAQAETWEMAVCPDDEADLVSGHKRMKAGDIIAVKPYPWTWGVQENKRYLIIIVNNLTPEEAYEMMETYYEDDNKPTDTQPSVITAKRKFKFDLGKLKDHIDSDLDLDKLKDKTTVYQPFKDNNAQLNIDTLDTYDMIQNKHNSEWRKAKKK